MQSPGPGSRRHCARRAQAPACAPTVAIPTGSSPLSTSSLPSRAAAGPWTTACIRSKSWALPVPGQGRGQIQNRQTRTGHRQGGGQSSHLAAGTWRQAPTCLSGVDTLLGEQRVVLSRPHIPQSLECPQSVPGLFKIQNPSQRVRVLPARPCGNSRGPRGSPRWESRQRAPFI